MEPSSDNEQQQLEEDIRQLDEALLDDNDGELYGSDLEGSRQSEDEAEPVHSIYDDEPEDITQQPSTSHASNLVDDFAHEGSNQEDADSEDDEEAEPSIQQLLVLNRRYQEFIVSNLRKVQDALEKNRLMQAELLDNKKRDREIFSGPSKLTPPYFRDKNFLSPPSNEEAVAISKKGYPMPVNPIYPKIWSKLELKSLKEGVKADGLEKMMCPLLNHREVLEGKFKKAQEQRDKQSKRALVKEISDIDVKLSELKVMPEQKILGEPKRDVDWHKVSSRYLEGKRTVAECQLKWQNYAHPLVRHEWTDEDDRQLKKIARVHNAKDWNIIASELGRGFTAFECLQRYQQRLNDDLYKRPYTEAEDQLLAQLVEKFRIGNHIPWIKVAYFLNDRKAKQCSHRWQSKLDPSIRNGKWSDWEDQILLGAVKKYKGRDWTKVAFGIPGRCGQQCRNRWVNVLNPGLRKGRFSAAEDVILLESVKQCGLGHWSSVQTLAQKSSDFLPGRTTPMIMSRYRYLSLQQADKLKKEFKEKQTQHKKACIEQSMTSLVGDTQTALLDEMEETFEDYCNKFTKDELLDGMIASAKKRVTELGEKARWTNVGIASGVHYEVNKEQAGKWKKNQKALALAAQAANDFKDVKVSAPRTNTRHRRSENVLTYDPKKKKIPISQQNVLLDQQLIKAVFPSRTLMPNKFFEKKGRTTTRLSRSEYISSELNKKKPLTWGTAVLVLLKASRVDLHLCKGIIHRSARLPNINIIADKTDNLSEAPKYRPLATTPGGKLNNRPLTMMLNKSNAPEMISGEVIGQLSGTSESITSAKKQSNTIPGATLSAVKQNDLPVDKQSNPMYVVKTCDKRILLVSPGTSQATGSSSRGGSVSQYVGGRAGSIHGVTGSSNLSMANQRSRPPAMTQSGIDEVGDYATIVPTVPKRINSDADKGKAVKTSKCSYTVRTDGPSVTVPVVTSTTAVAGQSSGQQTQLFHKPLLLSTSSVASQGTAQNSLLQLSNSLLHQNQVGCNPGGVISNIQLINGTPSNVAHLVTSPLRVPPTGKSVTLSVSPISASSLSSVMTPSTTSGGIYQHAQSPTVAGLNTLAGTNQSLVKRNLGTSEVASTNGQGSTHLCDTAPLHNSGSGMIFSPQVLKKHKGRKRAWPQNPTVNPKIVIGVTKNPGDEPSSVEVPTLPKRMNNGADKGKAVKTSKSSSTVRTDEPSVTVPVVTSPTAVASQSSMSKSGQKYGEAGSAVNDENENYTKDASGPTLPLNKPCTDGVHCGADDEDSIMGGEGNLQKKAKMTQGVVIESGNKGSKPCSDGVHYGTDDEEDSITRGEGSLQKKAKTTQGFVAESGNKGSKPCSDGVHCGTDDEEDGTTGGEGSLLKKAKMTQGSVIESGNKGSKPCSDGVHCGTDDEEDSVTVGEGNLTKKAKMTQGSVIESGNKGSKPCSDGVHCGTDDEDDNKGSRAGGTKNSKQTENSSRIEGGDGSCSRIVAPSNKDGEVTTIQCGAVPMTQASAKLGGGGTHSGGGGDPAPIASELGISAKRPKRKAAPKPGSFVMSTSEDDEDSDREHRRRSSKAKKLKSGRLDVTNRSPSVLKSSQVPTSQLFTNLSQLLAPSPILPVGGSTTTSVLNLGQTQLPLLGRTTPIIASKPTILVGPGGVILGLLPGTSPVLQLPQIPSVLNPTINTLPNIAVQQPLMNNAVISNLLQQQNVLLQQPLGTTVNPKLITLPNLTVQPPVSGTTNTVTLPSVSVPALNQRGGTSINANVTVPSNQLQNTMKGTSGMIGAKPSPIIVSLTSAASPVAQSYAATTVPHLFPLSSSIIVPTSQSGGVIQHVIPQGQTSVNHVSNFTNVVTSTGPVNSLPGVGNVIAPTQLSSAIPSGVVKLSHSSAVPSGSVVPKKSAGLTVKNMLPPRSLLTTSEMPSGGSDIPPPATKKKLRKGKKSSTNSISGILKEIEKMKPNKKSKCVMLPHIMKDDQYTVDFDKLEEFSKSILGTPEINFEKEMPMLPPNLVTLFSFKHLLIKKISLEDKASEFSMTLGELQDLKNGTVSTKKATWLENIADEEIPITRQQFLKEMRENPMYSLFKERFTMLFLWPAFLSLLAPFPSRKKRTVVCQPKTQQKLQKEKESQAEGKKVSSEENNEISNITELDKSVDGKGGETVRRGRGRPRVERKVGDKSDAKKTNNSGSTRKKRTVRKVTSPQLPTRRGTRATPLRKNVKKSATKEVAAVSNRREEEESPGKTS